jgi:hypothetical protein
MALAVLLPLVRSDDGVGESDGRAMFPERFWWCWAYLLGVRQTEACGPGMLAAAAYSVQCSSPVGGSSI